MSKPSKHSKRLGQTIPRRAAGVLLPISALPSRGPIGDLGPAAYAFIDWLVAAGQRYWQILPLSLPDSHGSPYASPSSMAGSWMYVSQTILRRDGLLPPGGQTPKLIKPKVVYRQATRMKWRLIRRSWTYFERHGSPARHREFLNWRRHQASWLTDFTLYQAVKDRQKHRPWWRWPAAWRIPAEARRHLDWRLRRQMDLHAYAQWLFDQQWQRLHAYAQRRRIDLIGDLPFYVQDDSVEVWTQPELFELKRDGRPRVVAGVPPDDFSRIGQRWGNPVYHWPAHRRQKFSWWIERVRRLSQQTDVIRFDHFQGLAETYHIPDRGRDGRRGRWVKTPGHALLRGVMRLPGLRLIAEDVGHPEPDAEHLRRHYRFPAIRILQFGWSGLPDNIHQPDHLRTDCLYFTSTHDTNTIMGWWRRAKWYERLHWREAGYHFNGPMHWQMIAATYASRAKLAMVAVQDVLGQGRAAQLNRPGRVRGNWVWRMPATGLSAGMARRLKRLTRQTGR